MTGVRWAAELAVDSCRDTDACLAIADETSAVHVRWAGNAMTTNGATRTHRLTVIAIAGDAAGVVSQYGGLDEESVIRLVRAAERTARRAAPAPDFQPVLTGDSSVHDQWLEPPEQTSFAEFGKFVPELARTFERARHRRTLLYGYAEHQVRTTYLASSTGLRLRYVQPTGILDLTAKPADHTASAWAGSSVPDFSMADPGAVADHLNDRLNWATRRVDLPVGRYEVLLPPSGVADLMLHLYQAATAQDAVDGHTVFSACEGATRVGERLTEAPLTLHSDPHEPGLECAPFTIARASSATTSIFDNGLPLSRTNWITDGVLTALVQTRHSARTTRLPHTPEIDNLVLTGRPAGQTLDDLIAGTRRGLLLTSLWYLRDVDPRTLLLTGLTRDGVYLVENGEVVGAVHDFRFNESPVALLSRVTDIGRTERTLPREWGDYFTRMAMPALRIEDFTMSSISQTP